MPCLTAISSTLLSKCGARAVEAGYLWVNTYGGIIPETPYGGFKQSGIGKELGAEGIDNSLETKCVNIFTGESTGKWYKG